MTSRITQDMHRLSTVASVDQTFPRYAAETATEILADVPPAAPLQVGLPAPIRPADDLYIPDHYESRYAYPLIVWLTGADEPQSAFRPLMRRISERNCLGVAVPAATGRHLEDSISEAVTGVRRKYHVHSERIYLAGTGLQGALALETGFNRPEWFGGIVSLSTELPAQRQWLNRFDALRGKRVFLGAGRDDADRIASTRQFQRLLWSAGLSVHAFTYDADEQLDDGILRQIDRWMIHAIENSAIVE
jgi:phospholipase/carboxylesterase